MREGQKHQSGNPRRRPIVSGVEVAALGSFLVLCIAAELWFNNGGRAATMGVLLVVIAARVYRRRDRL